MPTTTTKLSTCKCGSEFKPIIGFNGIVQSNSCPQCRYDHEIERRKQKLNKVVEVDVKEAKKALKTKIKPEKKPKTSERKLIEKLDAEFSLYIRHRDSKNGVFTCISCGLPKFYSQADCGHYINRQHLSTRFDEVNCNAQCRKCNRFGEGNNQGYRIGLINKYGEQAVNLLDVKKSTTKKFSSFDLEILIKHYKEKNREYLLSGELF